MAKSEPTIDELERLKDLRPEIVATELERIASEARQHANEALQ
jgi:hypothetical protein